MPSVDPTSAALGHLVDAGGVESGDGTPDALGEVVVAASGVELPHAHSNAARAISAARRMAARCYQPGTPYRSLKTPDVRARDSRSSSVKGPATGGRYRRPAPSTTGLTYISSSSTRPSSISARASVGPPTDRSPAALSR